MAMRKIVEFKQFEYDTLLEREKHIRCMRQVGWEIVKHEMTAIGKPRVVYRKRHTKKKDGGVKK